MKKILFSFVALIISVALGVFVCEIIVRIVSPQQLIRYVEGMYQGHDTNFHHYSANVDFMINSGEGPTHFKTDRYGHRINADQDSSAWLEEPDLSILIIGDSFVAGMGVENRQTIAQDLKRLFETKYPLRARVTNAGTPGWSPNQYYLETKRMLPLLHPDLGIVCLYVGNDFISRIDTVLTVKTPRPPPQTIKGKVLFGIRNFYVRTWHFLEGHSHLFVFCQRQLYIILPKFGKTMGYFPPIFFKTVWAHRCWDKTVRVCTGINNTFNSYHIPLLFILLPMQCQTNENMFWKYMRFLDVPADSCDLDLPEKILTEALTARSINCIDPLRAMRKAVAKGLVLNGFRDRHFNAAGHQFIADYIFPYAEERLRPVIEAKSGEKRTRRQQTAR